MEELESRVEVPSSFRFVASFITSEKENETRNEIQDHIYSICLDSFASDLPLGSSVIASPSSSGYLDLKILILKLRFET